MKYFLSAFILVCAFSANARPGERFNRPEVRPVMRPAACTYNLEEEKAYRTGFRFVQSFTEFGGRACLFAEDACERERMSRWDSWNYRCTEDFSTRSTPTRRCEYRIETRRGFEPEVFSVTGPAGCGIALDQCEKTLKSKRARGTVGSRAVCVQTSSSVRPSPPPARLVSASCTVGEHNSRARAHRVFETYTATDRARSYQEARDRACSNAMDQCQRRVQFPFYCKVI